MAFNLSPIGIVLLAASAAALGTRALPNERYIPPLRILVVAALVVELAGYVMSRNGVRNLWLYDLYLPLEFVLVLWVSCVLWPMPKRGLLFGIGLGVYAAACAYDLFYLKGALGRISAVSFLTAAMLLVPLLFASLVRVANSPERSLLADPYVWVLLALMVYFAGLVPCIAFFNLFLKRNDYAAVNEVITVVQVLFVLRSALTTVACWKLRTPALAGDR